MNDDNIKLYDEFKSLLATTNRLETIQKNFNSVIDFFSAPILSLTAKLCNDSLSLLTKQKFVLERFRRTEELLWKRVYHDIYRQLKANRQPLNKQDEHLVESHFVSGIGFYSTMIIRLRARYQIHDINHILETLSFSLAPLDDFAANLYLDNGTNTSAIGDISSTSDHLDPAAQKWARNAIYRSLVYMGDLARYMVELSDNRHRGLAFKFYLSASRFQPEFGLPFSQLATLTGGSNHNLDAVCSYMRCISRAKAFEGAEGNIKRIYSLNDKLYRELAHEKIIKASEVLASKNPVHDAEMLIRSVIITFIKLTSSVWSAISDKHDDSYQDNLINLNRLFFEKIREAIDIDPFVPFLKKNETDSVFQPLPGRHGRTSRPHYLTPTIMYEFSSIAIMLIARSRKEQYQPVEDRLLTIIDKLALNLLHYAANKSEKTIISKLNDLRIRQSKIDASMKQSSESYVRDMAVKYSKGKKQSEEDIDSSLDSNRRILSRLSKKKAASNLSDSNGRLEIDHDSEMGDLEETALSTIDALDISSGMSDSNSFRDLIDFDSESQSDNNNSVSLKRLPMKLTRNQNYGSYKLGGKPKTSPDSLTKQDLVTGDLELHAARGVISRKSQVKEVNLEVNGGFRLEDCNRLESILSYLYLHTYLPTVKVLFDWLLSNVSVINSDISSFKNFSSELKKLASLLSELIKMAESERNSFCLNLTTPEHQEVVDLVYDHKFDNPDWVQKFPLSCDFPLINLGPLKNVHDINIDFACSHILNNPEAGYVTSQCIFAFSHALSKFLKTRNC